MKKRARNQFSSFKFLNYINLFQKLAKGEKMFPVMAELDLTDACNHRCSWCVYKGKVIYSKNFTYDQLNKVFGALSRTPIRSVIIKGGGEPTISPIFAKSLYCARKHNLKVAVETNGSRFVGRNLQAVLDCCEWVRISLDAATSGTHTLIHKPYQAERDGFDYILKNIRNLLYKRDVVNSHVTVGLNFTTHKMNYKEIVPAGCLAKELGVDYISFRCARWYDVEINQYIWNEIKESFRKVKMLQNSKMIVETKFIKHDRLRNRKWKYCVGPSLIAVVECNGNVTMCCDSRGIPEFIIGNILKQSLEEIWYGSKREKLAKMIPVHKCYEICTDRYGCYNRIIDYLGNKNNDHVDFL